MSGEPHTVPKLAFLHVPKCGGVSVESELKKRGTKLENTSLDEMELLWQQAKETE